MATTIKEQHSRLKTTTKLSNYKHCFFSLTTLVLVFILLQIQLPKSPLLSLKLRSENVANYRKEITNLTSRLRMTTQYLPLKDRRYTVDTGGNTWFMSSLDPTPDPNLTNHLQFPSESSKGRLLCLGGNDPHDGTVNSYALAWRDSLPDNATLLPGLTFVSNTRYDFTNIWHAHGAVFPFVGWHKWKGCAAPARWVLYHSGELRTEMSPWVRSLAEATLKSEVEIESLDGNGGVRCFEEAVVFRQNEGSIARRRWREVYDMIRCRAREYCDVKVGVDEKRVGLTLLLRVGGRSFKNDSAVIGIFRRVCREVEGCRLQVAWPHNMTFCEQVRVLSNTDVLVSAHGAQMTNMIFMDKNSSIMEFYPKGWQELAGPGQYVFRWLADRLGMRHVGSWWDTESGNINCTRPDEQAHCDLTFYKNGQLGHDEAFFSNWTTQVLYQVRDYKSSSMSSMIVVDNNNQQPVGSGCSCW